jgi:hypothetical protein
VPEIRLRIGAVPNFWRARDVHVATTLYQDLARERERSNQVLHVQALVVLAAQWYHFAAYAFYDLHVLHWKEEWVIKEMRVLNHL